MTSLRLEDLKEELIQLKDRICIKLKQGITEGTLNNFLSEGDDLIKQIKKELNDVPYTAKREIFTIFSEINNSWNKFKIDCKNNPSTLIGGVTIVDMPSTSSETNASSYPQSTNNRFDTNLNLAKGINILEKTSQSLHRASQAAREAEEMGTNTLTELGGQRESLLRTRGRLDETNQNLRKTHLVLRTLHRRVLTNKFFLYLIIIVEIMIGGLLIYGKWFKK